MRESEIMFLGKEFSGYRKEILENIPSLNIWEGNES
jgi:hypothetical protein